MVKINLEKLMKNKNISRYKLQQLTNWNYKRINSIYFSKVAYLTLEEMQMLCYIFDCTIDELITVKK